MALACFYQRVSAASNCAFCAAILDCCLTTRSVRVECVVWCNQLLTARSAALLLLVPLRGCSIKCQRAAKKAAAINDTTPSVRVYFALHVVLRRTVQEPSVRNPGGRRRGAARQLPTAGLCSANREASRTATNAQGQPHAAAEARVETTDAHRSSIRAEQRLASPAREQGQPHPRAALPRATSHHVALGSYRTVRLRVEDVTGETEEEAGRARQTLVSE